MKITVLTITLLFSLVSFASNNTCKSKLDAMDWGSPFSAVNKATAIEATWDGELSKQETAFVAGLLEQQDTEVYTPYDSSDAGLYLHIVEKVSCKELWSGFVQSY